MTVIAVFPAIASYFGITREFSKFFGGSSLLITVGVFLDTIQQIQGYLLMRYYKGIMKSGKIGKY